MKTVKNVVNRIKQGSEQGLKEVSVDCSKYSFLFVELLYTEGFISGYYKKDGLVYIILKYSKEGQGGVTSITFNKSKYGGNYRNFKDLKKLALKGRYYVISSNLGFIYSRRYLSLVKGVGGSIVCEIL